MSITIEKKKSIGTGVRSTVDSQMIQFQWFSFNDAFPAQIDLLYHLLSKTYRNLKYTIENK